ncbi:oxygen-independent coproporphyrinogen III oxidase [Zooshikella sp. RANM57]|uniref:oxygen-independent coproporphyrinogen III oxidase n=1 Tax=Zooshikella sp. RANM57 TaxID=3425863 RepID=UPI003D6FEB06
MVQALEWDSQLIHRYAVNGPRYTSYPTAVEFTAPFSEVAYLNAAKQSKQLNTPLSLYFHIPFCSNICYYCACNKVITKQRNQAVSYIKNLIREMHFHAEYFGQREVTQLHWGGGTPTYLSLELMQQLMEKTNDYFQLVDDASADYSIEIDPREADWATMGHLRQLGFNRISLGIQDFNPIVQQAVNRVQTEEETLAVIDAARTLSFKSINVDLIYGLPHQNTQSFLTSLDKVLELAPNRLSIFNYAHLPDRFKPQRRINEKDLPSPAEKLSILKHTIEHLIDAGYVYIGMDHFALPEDELTEAKVTGQLHRNFQGYTTHKECDLLGFGCSAISQIGNTYWQNLSKLNEYSQQVSQNVFPFQRGFVLSIEDLLRREVISQLICHFELNIHQIEQQFEIDFNNHFAYELEALQSMADDGLLIINKDSLLVQPKGQLLIRNICMVFDQYLAANNEATRFSKVI